MGIGRVGIGGGNVGFGKPGTVGIFGGLVCRRWRAVTPISMPRNAKAAKNAMMKDLEKAIAKCASIRN